MTEEEMAEEYVDTLMKKDEPELDKFLDENLGDLKLTAKQAGILLGITKGVGINSFLAGLKAGRPKWHRVSEQIPTEEKEYLVKLTDGTIDVMTIALDGNLEPYLLTPKFDFYKDIEKWCEIPEES